VRDQARAHERGEEWLREGVRDVAVSPLVSPSEKSATRVGVARSGTLREERTLVVVQTDVARMTVVRPDPTTPLPSSFLNRRTPLS
jgi:hypothetical protein